jgi:hypothetical protein
MRFVRHAGMPDWGLGVVASDDGSSLDVLFEGIGHKRVVQGFAKIVDVPDADVSPDHRLRRRDDWPKIARDGARAQARRDLPKRFEGFVREFLDMYPEGLHSPACESNERGYKWKAVEYARATLVPDLLAELMRSNGHTEIIRLTRRVLGKTNLAFPNELMKFDDLPESAHESVAGRLVELVSAEERTPEALQSLAESLRPHGAHKWTLCSLIPFLLAPEKWPFVKPTAIERCATATGIDVEYEPMPNARTYRLVRDLYETMFNLLTDRGFRPRDAIDVQTFLWIGSGMAREMREARATDGSGDSA